jgi:riboflavin synthase
MFTGIIEALGEILQIKTAGTNVHYQIASTISQELKVDQSLSHDGVCLTVTKLEENTHWVTAIDETLTRSTLGKWKKGDHINLERAMLNNGRFDGHVVQGHVDQVGKVASINEKEGSWLLEITYESRNGHITVEKGSITVNGVSLTCFNSKSNGFSVAIIPYTYENTNISTLMVGDSVNLEFDIIGKYVQRLMNVK